VSKKRTIVWVLDKVGEGELYPHTHTHTKCEKGNLIPTVTPPWSLLKGKEKWPKLKLLRTRFIFCLTLLYPITLQYGCNPFPFVN
jgi:hypothetical protein